ncbi:DUF4231 domain-containing protein [Ktedonosporobacter rubrisoli]|uniref:DUF4231 domain-containing protein n=1 Tax=Ktedonosporobacter rubrisoli TaxID=2509675 RepID=A0A4V0YYI4_KTERU|nr:DUF4231 domain-containing protein [Ktedonosporobacter rubrisoli]QBD76331.1 DUF4231 domain-containing protein [Ktedonosporobacter rubrisoli]
MSDSSTKKQIDHASVLARSASQQAMIPGSNKTRWQLLQQAQHASSVAYTLADPQNKQPLETPVKIYQAHVLSLVRIYEKRSSMQKLIHHILQITIFVGAALVTVIVGIPEVPKLAPALLSGVVTIATALANYYKFGEHSRDLYLTSEDLAQEYNWFGTKRGPYKEKDAEVALELFMDRTETLIRKQTKRSFALGQQKEKLEEGK